MVFSFELLVNTCRSPATRVARAADLRVQTAPAVQAKINFQMRYCASRWHQRCQWVNGEFGKSPFRGQLSGKRLLASVGVRIDTAIKAQWPVESLFRA